MGTDPLFLEIIGLRVAARRKNNLPYHELHARVGASLRTSVLKMLIVNLLFSKLELTFFSQPATLDRTFSAKGGLK